MKNLTPPKWAPSAVATEQGWVHPKTGELLISLKGLKSRIEKEQPATTAVVLEIETPIECPVENAFVEITTEEPAVIEVTTEEPAVIEVTTEEPVVVEIIAEPVSEEIKDAEVIPEKKVRGRPKKNQNES